jgi:shikimate kinase
MKDQYMEAVRHARRGELVQAMRINGLITAGILGDDTELIKKVNEMGALAGGTTGTGPAQAFIFDDRGSLIRAGRFLEKRGRVIYTGPAEKEGYAMVV